MSSHTGFGSKFNNKVKELIGDENDKEKLFESLRNYQTVRELGTLLSDLRRLFNDPSKLELYEHIRPLILLKHQIEYSRKTPSMPGVKLRVVRLQRQSGESFGFAVRGGFEHGVGVFVSDVKPGSQADKRGLKVGDEIIRVNGFTISEAIHEDVLNLIKSREEIVLKVTHIGMLPNKETPTENVSWSYVEKMDSSKALQEVLDGAGNKNRLHGNELKIFINTSGANSIGCGILSGPNHFPGIFIEKVKPESLAEEAGLEVGDQIVEVNGTTFHSITHKEAVVTLKGSKQLDMVIRKKVGMALFEKSQGPNQHSLRVVESKYDADISLERHSTPPLPDRNYHDSEISQVEESDIIHQHLANRNLSSSNERSRSPTYSEIINIQEETTSYNYSTSSTEVTSPVKHKDDPALQQELDSLIQRFQDSDIAGKDLELVKLVKNKPLGIEIEGGIGTPIADRIQVSEIYTDGCVFENGEIQVGDQLMMVDGKSLLNMSAAQARNILTEADNKSQNILKIVIAKRSMLNDEDAVTFF